MKTHPASPGARRSVAALLSLAGLVAAQSAFSAIEVTGSGTYSENFDGLPALVHHTEFDWTDDLSVKGFYLHRSNAPTGTNNVAGALTAGQERPYSTDGSQVATNAPNFHGFLNLGVSNDSDRALGFSPTTSDGTTNWAGGELSLVAVVTNSGTLPVKITAISYDIEVLRNNSTLTVVEPITFTAKQGAAATLLSELGTYTNTALFSVAGYTAVDGGLFNFSYDNTANTAPFTTTRSATLATPLTLLPGGSIAFRWGNANEGGADAQIGIDNLSITTEQAAAAITATASSVTRNTNNTPAIENDDMVEFDLVVEGSGSVSPSGWKVSGPAGTAILNQTGTYGAIKHLVVPYPEFLPSGSKTFTVEDVTGGAAVQQTFTITAPLIDAFVSGTVSPTIHFTEPAVGAQSYTRTPSSTELGWTSSAATGIVRDQPDGAQVVDNKYFGVNNGTPRLTTERVNISGVASVKVKAGFAAYTTSTSGLEADDVLNAIVETSVTGDFTDAVEVGRLISSTGTGALTGTQLFALIKVDPVGAGINYPTAQPYPDTPFPFVQRELEFPRGTANYARLRVLFDNDSGSEFTLIDEIVFSGLDRSVTASVTNVFRNENGTPSIPGDDTVSFTLSVTGQGSVSANGWKITAPAGPFLNVTGSYGVDKTFTDVPIATFGPGLSVSLTIQDADAGASAQTTAVVTVPKIPLLVTTTQSQVIDFTSPAIGATEYSRPEGGTEPGWTGGVALAHVQEQPAPADPGNKYFDINTTALPAGDVLVTEGINIANVNKVAVSVGLAAYTTSGTGLEATDLLDVIVEVSGTADFQSPTIVAGGRLVDSTVTTGDVLFNEIKVADPGINYGTGAGQTAFPSTPFPLVSKTVIFDRGIGETFVRVRIARGVNSASEHIIVDNIRFANGDGVVLDSDNDGISDAYETANGLNPNSNADRDTDLDGDGQSNYREFLAGTAANNSSSTLRIVSLTPGAGFSTLVWTSVAGKTYRIETSTNLSTWQDQGIDYASNGDGTTTSIFLPPAGATGFVRVKVKP